MGEGLVIPPRNPNPKGVPIIENVNDKRILNIG